MGIGKASDWKVKDEFTDWAGHKSFIAKRNNGGGDTGGGGGGDYVAPAVNFDNGGIAQFVPDFSAASIVSPDGATDMLLAGWFGQMSGNGPNFGSVGNFGGLGYAFVDDGTNGITAQCIGFTETGALFNIHTITPPGLPTDWHSWAISIRPATHTFQLMVDRALVDTSSMTWSDTAPIGFRNGDPWDLGFDSQDAGSFSVSDTRIGANEGFFDLSVTANVDKLFSPTNKPISWGADGSLVTGSAPMIFLTGNAATYQNAGTGGPFVLNGSLTNATTSPSD